MEENKNKNKPTSPRQPYHNWYAAAYGGEDLKFASSMRYIVDTLMARKTARRFLTDLSKNFHLIEEELKDPDYYKNAETEMHFTRVAKELTYDLFVGYKKMRLLAVEKLIPSYAAIVKQEVAVVVNSGAISVALRAEPQKFIPMQEVKEKIGSYFDQIGEDYKICDVPEVIRKADVSGKPYAEVEKKSAQDIQVDERLNAKNVIDFIDNFRTEVADPKYIKVLGRSITQKSLELPVTVERAGRKEYVPAVLPNVLKNFLNPDHKLNSQDIASAMMESKGVMVENETSQQLYERFKVQLEKKEPKVLFNESWLEQTDFELIRGYVPFFTNLKSCSWVLEMQEKFQFPGVVSAYKVMLGVVRKIAKFFGLWIRGRLKPSNLLIYMDKVLNLKSTHVMGYVIRENLNFWMRPVQVTRFRESAISVVEGSDLFGDTDFDKGLAAYLESEKDSLVSFEPFEDNVTEELDRDKDTLDMGGKRRVKIVSDSEDDDASSSESGVKKKKKDSAKKKKKKKKQSKDDDSRDLDFEGVFSEEE